jgi:hypothetical protein
MDLSKWRPEDFCPIARRSAALKLSLATRERAISRAHAFSADSPQSKSTEKFAEELEANQF